MIRRVSASLRAVEARRRPSAEDRLGAPGAGGHCRATAAHRQLTIALHVAYGAYCAAGRQRTRASGADRLNDPIASTVVEVVEGVSDDELLRRIEALYRGSYVAYYRVALGMLRDREGAHDAVQEAFARAVRGRHDFRGSGSLRGWVWRALSRICLDEIRVPRAGAQAEPSDEGAVESDEAVRAAVAALPERQRWTIFLRYYADLSYEEIAAVLEVERGTVAATLHAARKALLPAIEEVAR